MTSAVPWIGVSGAVAAIFQAQLNSSLVPDRALGSSTPTFTRATTAYVEDWEGLYKLVPSGCARLTGARFVRNLLVDSEDNTVSIGSSSGVIVAATTVQFTNANGYHYLSRLVSSAGTFRISVTLSSSDMASIGFRSPGVSISCPLTATPTRFTLLVTGTVYTDAVGLENRGAFGGSGLLGTVTATNWQIEEVTGQSNQNPSEYVSVGVASAPYHGAGIDGAKYFLTLNGNQVTSNVVTEGTGAAITSAAAGASSRTTDTFGPKGYFAEGARTNRCLHSQGFSNAVWVSGGGGITVTTNSTTAPDGTTTADTLTAAGANGTLIQDLGVVASAAKAGGLYLKRKTGTGNIDLTLDGGATWTTVAVTSSWLLLEKTQTLADEDFGIRIVTSGDEVYAWNGQVETASFLSSPIPTTTVAVARNADVLTYAASGNINVTVGSCIVEATAAVYNAVNPRLVEAGAGNPVLYLTSETSVYSFDGTDVAFANVAGSITTAVRTVGVAWGTGFKCFKDGTAGAGATFDGSYGAGATFAVLPSGALFGNARNLVIYGTQRSDAQMQADTA